MSPASLTQAYLFQCLHYDPETGIFRWRQRADMPACWNVRYAGQVAGNDFIKVNQRVIYRRIVILRRIYLAHRLAVFYMTGEWPDAIGDHKDRNGQNNRWNNLRLASKSQNRANSGLPITNTTGFKGVYREGNKFSAQIRSGPKIVRLGSFDSAEAAADAYRKAATAIHGEYARAE